MLLSPVWLIAFGLPDWRHCLLLMLPMLADGFAQRLTPYQSGNLRRETFLLKKSYLDIHSSASQDFEDEEAEANDEKRAEEARKALASAQYHRIRSGDTLGGIAVRYGTTVSRLCQLNGISRTTTLRIGRSLRVR